jgi:hypothetical protein
MAHAMDVLAAVPGLCGLGLMWRDTRVLVVIRHCRVWLWSRGWRLVCGVVGNYVLVGCDGRGEVMGGRVAGGGYGG